MERKLLDDVGHFYFYEKKKMLHRFLRDILLFRLSCYKLLMSFSRNLLLRIYTYTYNTMISMYVLYMHINHKYTTVIVKKYNIHYISGISPRHRASPGASSEPNKRHTLAHTLPDDVRVLDRFILR